MAWSVTIYFTEQGQMFWVVFCLGRHGWRFDLVSMVSINRRIWLCGVETVKAGETVDIKEIQ
jgi:ABC-type cobalamin transport system permease subunit